MDFGGVPQYSDYLIPGDANRVIFLSYSDLSDVSSNIIKILLIFFLTGHLSLGMIFVQSVWTWGWMTLQIH